MRLTEPVPLVNSRTCSIERFKSISDRLIDSKGGRRYSHVNGPIRKCKVRIA